MRLTMLTALALAAALGLGGAAKVSAKTGIAAGVRLAAVTNGCVAGTPVIGPSPSYTVTLKQHQCYKAGHTIPTATRFTYKQLDYGGSACGSPVSNSGPSFTPRLKTTFYVSVNFTVSPLKSGTGIRPRSTGWKQLQTGHWQLQCGKLVNPFPTRYDVCGINPDARPPGGNYECDFNILDDSFQSKPMPRFGGMPMQIGNTIYPPKLLIPSGTCSEKVEYKTTLMTSPTTMSAWSCPGNLLVDTQLIVFYFPPGSSTVCPGPRAGNLPNPYTVGPVSTIPSETFTHVLLPPGAASWGGHAQFVFHELVHPFDGKIQKNGFPITVAEQYANIDVQFSGTQNGCNQMSQFGG